VEQKGESAPMDGGRGAAAVGGRKVLSEKGEGEFVTRRIFPSLMNYFFQTF